MSSPRVSVVIAACDAAGWIGDAIASAASQTWSRDALQIIVIDDGSRDGTVEAAARAIEASRVPAELIRTDASRGPAAARNVGIERADGDWIQILDADDLLAPEKVAHQMRVAASAPEDVAVVISPWQRLTERGGAWKADGPIVAPSAGEDALLDVLRADNVIATGSQLFRRVWLERVGGYDARVPLIEDIHLLARLVMAGGRIVSAPSPAPLFWYRQRAGSLSSSDRRGFVEAQVRNTELAEAHWRASGALTPVRRRFLAESYAAAVRGWVVDHPAGFEGVADRIEALQPGFLPGAPARVRRLARLVGYRRAERAAARYRRLKALVTGGR